MHARGQPRLNRLNFPSLFQKQSCFLPPTNQSRQEPRRRCACLGARRRRIWDKRHEKKALSFREFRRMLLKAIHCNQGYRSVECPLDGNNSMSDFIQASGVYDVDCGTTARGYGYWNRLTGESASCKSLAFNPFDQVAQGVPRRRIPTTFCFLRRQTMCTVNKDIWAALPRKFPNSAGVGCADRKRGLRRRAKCRGGTARARVRLRFVWHCLGLYGRAIRTELPTTPSSAPRHC